MWRCTTTLASSIFLFPALLFADPVTTDYVYTLLIFQSSFTAGQFNAAKTYGKLWSPQPSVRTNAVSCENNPNEWIMNITTTNAVEAAFVKNLGNNGYILTALKITTIKQGNGGGDITTVEPLISNPLPSDCHPKYPAIK